MKSNYQTLHSDVQEKQQDSEDNRKGKSNSKTGSFNHKNNLKSEKGEPNIAVYKSQQPPSQLQVLADNNQ